MIHCFKVTRLSNGFRLNGSSKEGKISLPAMATKARGIMKKETWEDCRGRYSLLLEGLNDLICDTSKLPKVIVALISILLNSSMGMI